ncbi:Ig-like domain-containing protein [Paenibacillus hexagrammi]|uniref:Ig-like domain-containing protein n=1 Tax=Paenibacillus hexagrammi TaxID=2908839 RepID=A0ABY3SL86_9BACL|nr:Ig-like domain-containing protein [Paenibacillus sp. YPD9-1]UJF33984.1 Ig-like domain-containing protein [Paenibacillus sp. YPD9-1]
MRNQTIKVVALACSLFLLLGCGNYMSATENTHGPLNPPMVTSTPEPSGWIVATTPRNGAVDVNQKTNIAITFAQDMNPDSLNATSILVLDGKHGDSMIQSMFKFRYEKNERRLYLELPEDSGYGSSNGIDVIVSGNIENAQHQKMGADYQFGFSVK